MDNRLLENIAAIAALVHSDDRMAERVISSDEPFTDRLQWCINAATALTNREPADYEAAEMDWNNVCDGVADAFFGDTDPERAVEEALLAEKHTAPELPGDGDDRSEFDEAGEAAAVLSRPDRFETA